MDGGPPFRERWRQVTLFEKAAIALSAAIYAVAAGLAIAGMVGAVLHPRPVKPPPAVEPVPDLDEE